MHYNTVQSAAQQGKGRGIVDLQVSFQYSNVHSLCSADLASLIRQSQETLETIKLHHVELQGGWVPVMQAVRDLKRLRSFRTVYCPLQPQDVSKAVAELPLLKELIIDGCGLERPGVIRMKTAADCRFEFFISDRMETFATAFLEALAVSQSLQSFNCEPPCSQPYVNLLAEIIRANTPLEHMKISLAVNTCLGPLAEALKYNNKLLTLDVTTSIEPSVADIDSFTAALKNRNMTLQNLLIVHKESRRWINISSKNTQPIYTYESGQVKEAAEMMEFYLSLNRAGRFKLLADPNHEATTEDWLDAIAHNNNLSEIFYFVSTNPLIFVPRKVVGGFR